MTFEDTHSTTSLPESEDGVSHSDSQAGRTRVPFSQAARRANRLAAQVKVSEQKTSDTLPLTSSRWSQPSGLLGSLASRLQPQSRKTTGSMIYSMHWKEKATPQGRLYCQLVASGRRTSDKDCGLPAGWPTAATRDYKDTGDLEKSRYRKDGQERNDTLPRNAWLAGWHTPKANEIEESLENHQARRERMVERHGAKGKMGMPLPVEVQLTGWKTPATQEPGIDVSRLVNKDGTPWTGGQRAYDKETGRLAQTGVTQMAHLAGWATPQASDNVEGARTAPDSNQKCLGRDMHLVGWPTPKASEAQKDSRTPKGALKEVERNKGPSVSAVAQVAGWPTPKTNDVNQSRTSNPQAYSRRQHERPNPSSDLANFAQDYAAADTHQPMRLTADGTLLTGSSAGMESGGQLNPAHSRWLMGYPVAWCQAAIQAMRDMPKQRKKRESRASEGTAMPSSRKSRSKSSKQRRNDR